MALFRST